MGTRIARILGIILRSDSDQSLQEGKIFIFPFLRLIAAILCILLCALSRNAVFTLTVVAVNLLRASLLPVSKMIRVLRASIAAALVCALIMCPSIFMGYPSTFGTVTLKVFESVLLLSILNETVAWKDMTGAFASLHLPSVFIFTLDNTVHYLIILGRFCNSLSEAVWLRTLGKKNWRRSGAGGVMGTAYLKSQRMSQRQYEAMLCRGYQGSYHTSTFRKRRWRDLSTLSRAANILYVCLLPAMLIFFAVTQI